MAEREGFEPSTRLLDVYTISSRAPSAARAPLPGEKWRRGWDSNPRGGSSPPTRFRVEPGTTTSVPLRASHAKEFLHQGARLVGEDPRGDGDPVVPAVTVQRAVTTHHRPRL